jgi:NADH-quinone oxidoreductase subunit M
MVLAGNHSGLRVHRRTAVYILRAAGTSIMGPIGNSHFKGIGDALWNEKLAACILITGIVAIGIAPFWLYQLITPGAEFIIQHVGKAVTLK